MNDADIALAKLWIKSHEITVSTNEAGELTEKLENLFKEHPMRAIQTLYFIAQSSDNENVLANLGAGPLVNFLNTEYGTKYIDGVISHAKRDNNWRLAFGCVWTGSYDNRELAKKIELNINLLFPEGRP